MLSPLPSKDWNISNVPPLNIINPGVLLKFMKMEVMWMDNGETVIIVVSHNLIAYNMVIGHIRAGFFL